MMKFIAHRGNVNGKNVERENQPDYIQEALDMGFDVEIDVWYERGRFYLGHDKPEYPIDILFLLKNSNHLWCHAKNLDALTELTMNDNINCFWHQMDDYTLTSHGYIWTYPNKTVKYFNRNQIVLLFDWNEGEVILSQGGICSDYIELYRMKFDK